MSRTALITTPRSDSTTRYISAWAAKTIEGLKSKQFNFVVLPKDRATASTLESMIKKHNPLMIENTYDI